MAESGRMHRAGGRAHCGATVVEFALVLPLLLLLIFGVIEFGRVIWLYESVAYGAREGVRYAMVRGSASASPATEAEIQMQVRGIAGLGAANVAAEWPDGNQDPGSRVKVMVSLPFDFLLPFVVLPNLSLSSASEIVIDH